jgi:hypothetical protein
MKTEDDRYQYQPWHIKIWRKRYYILIPFEAVRIYTRGKLCFRNAWKLAKGLAQSKMKWFWTMGEVNERFRNIFEKRKNKGN